MKRGISLPSGARTGKYRWWSCIVAISTSGGSSRKRGSKVADERHRPFRQAPSPRRARRGRSRPRRPPASRRGHDARADALAPRLEVGEHEAALSRAPPGSRRASAARWASRAWKRWPRVMRPAAIPRISQGDDVVAVQHHDPVHRAGRTGRRPRPSACAARSGAASSARLHDAGQELRGLLAGTSRPAEQELALGVVDARERVDRDAAGVGESGRGARRLAGGVEGGGHRRPAPLDALFRLAVAAAS